MCQWLQRRFCNLVSITVKFVTGSRNSYWLYRHLTQLRSAFGNITLYNFNIPFRFFFLTHTLSFNNYRVLLFKFWEVHFTRSKSKIHLP